MHGQRLFGSDQSTRLSSFSRSHVPTGKPGAPAADRHHRKVHRLLCQVSQDGDLVVQAGVTGEPDHHGRRPQQVAVGGVGAVRHRPVTMNGTHQSHFDSRGYLEPVIGD